MSPGTLTSGGPIPGGSNRACIYPSLHFSGPKGAALREPHSGFHAASAVNELCRKLSYRERY